MELMNLRMNMLSCYAQSYLVSNSLSCHWSCTFIIKITLHSVCVCRMFYVQFFNHTHL